MLTAELPTSVGVDTSGTSTLAELPPVNEWQGLWIVATLNSQRMDWCIRRIEERGALVYVPKVRVARTYPSGRRIETRPLFLNYAFVNLQEPSFDACDVEHVLSLIDVPNQKQLSRELGYLQQAEQTEAVMSLYPHYVKGAHVRVKTPHPMAGVQGVIVQYKGYDRFVLSCEILQQGTEVDIDAACLELID